MSLLLRALRQAEEQKKLQQSVEHAAEPEHPLPELQLDENTADEYPVSLSLTDMVTEEGDTGSDSGSLLPENGTVLLAEDAEAAPHENGPQTALAVSPKEAETAAADPVLPMVEPSAAAATAAQPVQNTQGAESRIPVSADKHESRVIWLMIVGGAAVLLAALWVFWQWYRLQPAATAPLASTPRASPVVTHPKPEPSEASQIAGAALAQDSPRVPATVGSPRSPAVVAAESLGASPPAAVELPVRAATAQQPRFERQLPAESEFSALLHQGWQHYQQGEFEQSLQAYRTVLRGDAGNRDALLAVAAIAVQQGRPEAAQAVYQRVLQLYPGDADAQAGLLALQSLDEADASRLQQQDHPANTLLLAQHYVRQQRWAEAQELYFQAWSRDPDNADLAFNLAVSLDQLGQPSLAREYYDKAIQLAARQSYRFNLEAAMRRLQQLKGDLP